ncbi:MAG: hypothetical protein OEY67_01515 [Gammaproteobacteria bacterium]|nr:hypothetical protein [Gammaproteobacteria bacterium]
MDAGNIARQTLGCTVIALVLGLSGCVYDHYHDHYHDYDHAHYWPYYDYFYYPSVYVYFHYHSGFYYYYSDNRWKRSKVLPPYIVLDPRERTRLRLDTDKPYLKNDEHRQRYRSRPDYKPDPGLDRREREENRRWQQQPDEKLRQNNRQDRKFKEKSQVAPGEDKKDGGVSPYKRDKSDENYGRGK